jgi:hypothetical protein
MRILVIALLWPVVAHANAPCHIAHYRQMFDPSAKQEICRHIDDAAPSVPIVHMRSLGASDRPPIPNAERIAVRELQDFMRRAIAAAGTEHLTLPPDLTLVLDPEPSQPEDRKAWLAAYKAYLADARHRAPQAGPACPIAYHYKSSDARKLRDVAHQLYHCMQPSDIDGPAESAAEHFAGVVYPTEVVAPATPRL